MKLLILNQDFGTDEGVEVLIKDFHQKGNAANSASSASKVTIEVLAVLHQYFTI
jgi:hypothetical protein